MPKSPEAKRRQAEYLREYKRDHPPIGKRINLTLSVEEFERVNAAKPPGETTTGFLHRLAMERLGVLRPALPQADAERFDAFVRVVRGIANNLNQMAHHSNALRGILDEREVGYQLQYLEDMTRRFFEGGGDGK